MTYNCKIKKEDNWYIAKFPDMPNIITCDETHEKALLMAKEALDGVLESHIENDFPIAEPKFSGGYPIEVSPKIAFAIELRKARAGRTKKDVAQAAGMSYQQYQRLENPRKTNPTLETLCRLQKVFNRQFLAV